MRSPACSVFALTRGELAEYRRDGFLVVRGLLAADEVDAVARRFEQIGRAERPAPGFAPDISPLAAADPLARYPRVMMPHRFDDLSLRLLLDPRIHDILCALLEDEPLAAQTMFYYKPPGARGQALHQDDFYLRTRPGACIAAWIAIDPAVPENGGLFAAPGSHRLDVLCPDAADESVSFTTHLVRPPSGMEAAPIRLGAGDVLFFGGSVIHGSLPNRSTLWRRSFISHYIPRGATHCSPWYFPLLDFDGNAVERRTNEDGGPCGLGFHSAGTSIVNG